MLNPLSYLALLIIKLKLKLRNKLTKDLPYFAYSNTTETGHVDIQLRHDENAYSCKVYRGDKLERIRTGRHDFGESYNVYFKNGVRYLSIFSKENNIIFNHKDVLIELSFNEEEVNLTVNKKGNSYV